MRERSEIERIARFEPLSCLSSRSHHPLDSSFPPGVHREWFLVPRVKVEMRGEKERTFIFMGIVFIKEPNLTYICYCLPSFSLSLSSLTEEWFFLSWNFSFSFLLGNAFYGASIEHWTHKENEWKRERMETAEHLLILLLLRYKNCCTSSSFHSLFSCSGIFDSTQKWMNEYIFYRRGKWWKIPSFYSSEGNTEHSLTCINGIQWSVYGKIGWKGKFWLMERWRSTFGQPGKRKKVACWRLISNNWLRSRKRSGIEITDSKIFKSLSSQRWNGIERERQ